MTSLDRAPLFQTLQPPIPCTQLNIEGFVPSWLRGILYRIGVGDFAPGYRHWFDGDGMLARLEFGADNSVTFQASLLHIPQPNPDRLGRFGIAPQRFWDRLRGIWTHRSYRNSANTALLHWQGRLFALYEGAPPTEVDHKQLTFIQETDLSCVRRSFTAHPKRQGARQFGFGFRLLPSPHLDIYNLPDQGAAHHFGCVPFNGAVFVHDFATTENHIVFIVSPVFADPKRMIIDGDSLADCIAFNPHKPTEIIVVPLAEPKKFWRTSIPPLLFTHTAQAFEQDNTIVIDGIAYPDGSNLAWIQHIYPAWQKLPQASPGQLTRFKIDLSRREAQHQLLHQASLELPTTLARDRNTIWAAGFSQSQPSQHGLYNALFAVHTDQGKGEEIFADEACAVTELIPIENPENPKERAGIAFIHNLREQSASAAIFDISSNAPRGHHAPLATIRLPKQIPFTFHGLWI